MAFLIKADGRISPLKPKNGIKFTCEELNELIGCELIQIVNLDKTHMMIVDESGALKKHRQKNQIATEMYQSIAPSKQQTDAYIKEMQAQGFNVVTLPGNEENFIYGTVVVCNKKQFT